MHQSSKSLQKHDETERPSRMTRKWQLVMAVLAVALLGGTALVEGIAIAKGVEGELPVAAQPVHAVNPNNGFTVQSGYEGYIVSPQKSVQSTGVGSYWLAASKLGFLKSLLVPVASFLLVSGAKLVTVGLHVALALLLGVAATTAVCTFTPLCTITLNASGLPFFKGQSVREQVTDLARVYMTPENMEMATKFVQNAIDKYAIGQRREAEEPAPEIKEPTAAEVEQNEAIPSH